MDAHSRHFHHKQAILSAEFRGIQARLLEGYMATLSEARIQMHDDNPLVAQYAAVRASWAERAARDLEARMADDNR